MLQQLKNLARKADLKLIASVIILSLVFLALAANALGSPVYRWGDASTYYMQVISIVHGHGIQYTQPDIQYVMAHPLDDVPAGMYMIKTADGRYYYGKDYTFALFASPFFALIGDNGILLFNAIIFFGMILMGYLYLRKENGVFAAGYATVFFMLSALFVYTLWMNPDVYDAFVIMLGLFLWLVYTRKGDARYLAIASLAFGLVAVSKAPDAIVFAPVLLFELYRRRYVNLLIAAGAFLLVVAVFLGYFCLQTGTLSFYGGNRLSYADNYPFWGTYNSTNEAGQPAFSLSDGSTVPVLINLNDLKIIPYNLFYYFFGRFTGMLWYYPFALFALVSFAFQCRRAGYFKEHPEKLCVLGAIVLYILTYTVLIGDNYMGGGWAVGNRYFYIYPAFLFLLDRVDLKKAIPFLAIALVTVLPLVSAPIATSNDVGAHTYQSPYTYFPLDMSQMDDLPLRGQALTDGAGNSFTVFNGFAAIYEGNLTITNTSPDMMILSYKPIDRLDLSLFANYGFDTGTVSGSGFYGQVPLTGKMMGSTTVSPMVPIYSDSRQYVYGLNVTLT